MGLVFADAGRARLLGRALDDPRCRERVGYLPENPYLYDYLTPVEYLDYVGRLFGMDKAGAARPRGASSWSASASPPPRARPCGASRRGCCSGWASPRRS